VSRRGNINRYFSFIWLLHEVVALIDIIAEIGKIGGATKREKKILHAFSLTWSRFIHYFYSMRAPILFAIEGPSGTCG
jgi:hypothetical protein